MVAARQRPAGHSSLRPGAPDTPVRGGFRPHLLTIIAQSMSSLKSYETECCDCAARRGAVRCAGGRAACDGMRRCQVRRGCTESSPNMANSTETTR